MVLKKLADIANRLDKEGKTAEASLVDKAMLRIAQMDDLNLEEGEVIELALPPSPAEEIQEYESGELEVLRAFVEALVDGAFESVEEAQKAAQHFLETYSKEEEMEIPEPVTEDSEPAGTVLEFPMTEAEEV